VARAACLIRPLPQFRRGAVVAGLAACGYAESPPLDRPANDDVIVIWNRASVADRNARRYDAAGGKVIVAENGYLGREWRGGHWYALARDRHNGAGTWPKDGSGGRWDGWDVPLADWRTGGDEIVVLAQRGIGQRELREPHRWALTIKSDIARRTKRPVRVRLHPGEKPAAVSLEDDLKDAFACVTWSSGAALKALLMGVPVFYGCPTWIGRAAAFPITADLEQPFRGDRLPMFRSLAWAMWSIDEIATGEPFRCLLA